VLEPLSDVTERNGHVSDPHQRLLKSKDLRRPGIHIFQKLRVSYYLPLHLKDMDEFDWDLSDDDRRPLPALLYVSFSNAITRYRCLVQRAKRRGALDYIAWITRNILELRVWVEYCSQSQQHCEEFYQDAVRDLNDLHRAVGGLDPEDVKTLQRANKFIGSAKPAHKFKDVKVAANVICSTHQDLP
jgi:hypothetical protein